MAASADEDAPFGPYIVYERLGVGGMATVHRALERGIEGFERIVALKRLLPHLAEDASFIKAFVREAKLASALNHVNIVQIFELGRVGTEYFISMEYIDGCDIRRILRHARKVTGPPPINVTIGLLLQLCDALDYAHNKSDENGVPMQLVHRDVSPSNVLVTSAGHVKVIDFGIAKAQSSQLRTQTGRVKGKLAYMAPEAVSGKELDARSDLFAIGVIAHELLTARPLFASKNEYQTLLKVQRGDIMPPSTFNQGCHPELDAIVLRALARDPDQRYSHAAELRDDLVALRKQYGLLTNMRDIATWLEWAFSLEIPTGGFAGHTGDQPSISMGSPVRSPQSRTPARVQAKRRSGSEVDDAVEIAWGEDKSEQGPIVLDDVPDVSGKHLIPPLIPSLGDLSPGPAGSNPSLANRLFDDDELDDDIPTPAPSHGVAPSHRSSPGATPLPYGSSPGLAPREKRTTAQGHQPPPNPTGRHATQASPDGNSLVDALYAANDAAATLDSMPAADTQPSMPALQPTRTGQMPVVRPRDTTRGSGSNPAITHTTSPMLDAAASEPMIPPPLRSRASSDPHTRPTPNPLAPTRPTPDPLAPSRPTPSASVPPPPPASRATPNPTAPPASRPPSAPPIPASRATPNPTSPPRPPSAPPIPASRATPNPLAPPASRATPSPTAPPIPSRATPNPTAPIPTSRATPNPTAPIPTSRATPNPPPASRVTPNPLEPPASRATPNPTAPSPTGEHDAIATAPSMPPAYNSMGDVDIDIDNTPPPGHDVFARSDVYSRPTPTPGADVDSRSMPNPVESTSDADVSSQATTDPGDDIYSRPTPNPTASLPTRTPAADEIFSRPTPSPNAMPVVRFREPTMPPADAPTELPVGAPLSGQIRTKPGHAPARALTAPAVDEDVPTLAGKTARSTGPAIGEAMLREKSKGPRKSLVILAGIVGAGAIATATTLYVTRGDQVKPVTEQSQPRVAPRTVGMVKFNLEPADAEIVIGGQLAHAGSPFQIELEAGVHQVQINRAGYKSWLTALELSASETQTLRVVLEPLGSAVSANVEEATLILSSTPSGLDAWLDGKLLPVKTPIKMPIKVGPHTIVLKKNDDEVWRQDLVAQANAEHEFSPSMDALKVRERAERRAAPTREVAPARESERPSVTEREVPAPSAVAPAPTPTTPTPTNAAPATTALTTTTTEPSPPPPTPTTPSTTAAPANTPTAPAIAKPAPTAPPAPPRIAGPMTIPPSKVSKLSGAMPELSKTRHGEIPPVVAAKLCIDHTGAVTSTDLITKLEARAALEMTQKLKSWRYTPYKPQGSPTPAAACFAVSFRTE
ncbi:MAG: protein kinase domain-containing protein [Kofleriaceae bacterium]